MKVSEIYRTLQEDLKSDGLYDGVIDGIYSESLLLSVESSKKPVHSFLLDIAKEGEQYNNLPLWMKNAFSMIGEREIKGKRHNGRIVGLWRYIKSKIFDDETSWCSAFVGACLEKADIISTRLPNARSYVNFGKRLERPRVGSIVVMWRESRNSWKGHVGFFIEQFNDEIYVIGGNQNDSVNISKFSTNRVLCYMWPVNT